jgi:hypothetical protein
MYIYGCPTFTGVTSQMGQKGDRHGKGVLLPVYTTKSNISIESFENTAAFLDHRGCGDIAVKVTKS